jgi:hypothetical protein
MIGKTLNTPQGHKYLITGETETQVICTCKETGFRVRYNKIHIGTVYLLKES